MAPPSQELEPPAIPGRFTTAVFWEESFPMVFWILNPMITASFEDLALRGQKPYLSSGEHRLNYSCSPSAGSEMQRVEGRIMDIDPKQMSLNCRTSWKF
jgi:hypothetical protein